MVLLREGVTKYSFNTPQRKAPQYYISTRKPICKIPKNRITYLRVLASNKHDMINEMFLAPRGFNNVH